VVVEARKLHEREQEEQELIRAQMEEEVRQRTQRSREFAELAAGVVAESFRRATAR
jgi:hypothetical protein